jgi:hypothetical protein
MQSTSAFVRRLDAFCARLNDGLIVVAAVLVLVVFVVTCEQQLPEVASLFQPIDPETGTSMLSH